MRQVEKFDVSPVEQELAFGRWCQKNEVKMVLADTDDTLCITALLFREQMGKAYDLLAGTGIMSREEWRAIVESKNNRLFESKAVNPNRWSFLVEELREFGLDDNTLGRVKAAFYKVYSTPLKFIDGTEDGLDFLNRVGMPIGIVTHANTKWTWRKYNEWLKLDRFLPWNRVYTVDENSHKTKESWGEAMRYFGVKPENCVVIGDSPRSDINPATELGVRRCFLVQNGDIWSIHQVPVNEQVTMSVRGINDLRWLGREVIFSQY